MSAEQNSSQSAILSGCSIIPAKKPRRELLAREEDRVKTLYEHNARSRSNRKPRRAID